MTVSPIDTEEVFLLNYEYLNLTVLLTEGHYIEAAPAGRYTELVVDLPRC